MNRNYTPPIKPVDARHLSCVESSDHIHTVQLLSKIHGFPGAFLEKPKCVNSPLGYFP